MDIVTSSLVSAFLLGLFSSAHCVAMCGSVIGALTLSLPATVRNNPVRMLPFVFNYNLGRIISYSLAGGIVGAITSPLVDLGGLQWLRGASILIMVGMGLYLAGWWPQFARIEKIGTPVWRWLQPLSQKLLPVTSKLQAFCFGAVWGWLPCGLVYAALITAAATGDPLTASASMLAFGLGTLPAVMGTGFLVGFLSKTARTRWFRRLAGILIMMMAIIMLISPLIMHDGHDNHSHQQHEHDSGAQS
ncbi:hypothetical protein Q7C_1808 [Methylophaga frappieri]|uniref:Urease accessory protein UreH-like transmembrane domain-containing protein n=1 Tax=Methylophaga frappieri (strain ATCC BAA-2434 / DSM 25690 / JAM7) TaxID=754477 RepID=I1YJ56_METFJ|nr:sulfite exporter TauE/SafE family protein [Methylophaga frappieri]AFJ02949.1 hypothetical protein Q7C_1808 [Methylophaga frappieri]